MLAITRRSVLACSFGLLVAASDVGGSSGTGAEPNRDTAIWRPLGAWSADLVRSSFDPEPGPYQRPAVPARLKQAIRARVADEDAVPDYWIGRSPDGHEVWIFRVDHAQQGSPDSWLLVLRDPATGTFTPEPAELTNQFIHRESPRIWFSDLDDDGRHEIAIRQYEHNGTMVNNDVRDHYRVGDDLALTHVLRQRTRITDLYSEFEAGAIRSHFERSDRGRLRLFVWRENALVGVGRRTLGSVGITWDGDGRALLVPDAGEVHDAATAERYDFGLGYALDAIREAPRVR